jgi:hypothetical protein
MTDTPQQFDWNDTDSVVVHTQPAIAIYPNKWGHVVIRRDAAWDETEDSIITIATENAVRIAMAILASAGHEDLELVRRHAAGTYSDIDLPAMTLDQIKAFRPDLNYAAAMDDFGKFEARDADRKAKAREKATERQRRRRDKQRDANRDATVTERDAQAPLQLVAAE